MHPLTKALIGIILMIVSAWWVWKGSAMYIGRSGIEDLITVLNGAVPVFVFLLGLFIVWLEYDEWKIEKELEKEEKKLRKKQKRTRRKKR